MKTLIHSILKTTILFSIFFTQFSAQAQAPQKMSYQAVIRNASNALVASTPVAIKVSLLQGSATGTAVFVERHTPTTNINGLASIEIGTGTIISGTFAAINWATGTYFVKTETDPSAGTNYTIVGTSQLTSVPYALSSADNKWVANANGINNISGNVGIGTTTPSVPVQFADVLGNKISLFGSANQQYGFGIQPGLLQMYANGDNNADIAFGKGQSSSFVETMRIAGANSRVGIGTINPTEKLEVVGKTKTTNLQVTTGAGVGKVLTSDATGNATWQTSPTLNTVSMKVFIATQGVFPSSSGTFSNETYLGEIRVFALPSLTFIPSWWMECKGQLLNINDNVALYALIGTTYGGNGSTNFALPDLTGKVIIGQ